MNVGGGTLTISPPSPSTQPTTLDALNFSGGTIAGTANITIGGSFVWSGGSMNGNSNANETIALGGATLSSGNTKVLTGRTLRLNSNTTWSGGTFQLNSDAILVNSAGRTFDISGDMALQWIFGANPRFDNAGTSPKSAGTGTTTLNFGLNNSGSVQIAAGTLHIGDNNLPDSSTGSFSVATGTTLEWATGTHNLGAGSNVTGAGTVRYVAGTTNLTARTRRRARSRPWAAPRTTRRRRPSRRSRSRTQR